MISINDVPFNMKFTLSENDLREIPEDAEQMQQGILFLLKKMKNEELVALDYYTVKAMLGSFYRVLKKYDDSETHSREAMKGFFELKSYPNVLQARISLCKTILDKGELIKAEKALNEMLDKINGNELDSVLDTIYFLLGRIYFLKKRVPKSLEYFLKALEIRLQKGDVKKIEQTNVAIKIIRSFESE